MARYELPDDVAPYRTTPSFTQQTVPDGLQRGHITKAGVWGRIVVEEGELGFTIDGQTITLSPGTDGIVPPEVEHDVSVTGPVRFHVVLHRVPKTQGSSTDPGKWAGLAARINQVLDDEDEEARRAEEEARRLLQEARAARLQLFEELVSFGSAVPRFDVQREPGILVLGHRECWIRFAFDGDTDGVAVTTSAAPEVVSHLQRDRTFGRQWMLCWEGDAGQRWHPLFDQGLEVLIHAAYGLELPEDPHDEAKAALFVRGTGNREKVVYVDGEGNPT